jgi:hypothetical protein
MRSKLFVSVGLSEKNCHATTRIIQGKLNPEDFPFQFTLKENLLFGRFNDVAFYVTILMVKKKSKIITRGLEISI